MVQALCPGRCFRSGQERVAQHRANVDDQPATLRPLEVGEACAIVIGSCKLTPVIPLIQQVLHDDMPNVLPKWMREGPTNPNEQE